MSDEQLKEWYWEGWEASAENKPIKNWFSCDLHKAAYMEGMLNEEEDDVENWEEIKKAIYERGT